MTFRCFSQTEPMSVERKNTGCWTSIDYNINEYTDSLNFWSINDPLPNFLFEANFDHSLMGLTRECFAKPKFISFRKAVFDRIVNEEILAAIVVAKDRRLDERYNPKELERISRNHPSVHGSTYPDLPYMKYSTRELAARRLEELRKKKELFNKK